MASVDKNIFKKWNCCAIIPTYNNDQTLLEVIEDVREWTEDVLIVNDGSTDNTRTILNKITGLHIIHFEENQGKGMALRAALAKADEMGFDFAITIDSDGQHLASDFPQFFQKLEEVPNSLIVGARDMDQEDVPGTSNFGHNFANFWFKVETGVSLPDTQTGFRLYPIAALRNMKFYTSKYEFETEVLTRASWRGVPLTSVPIDVYYPPGDERVTHFRRGIDFSRIFAVKTLFVIVALLYIHPRNFFRSIKKKVRSNSTVSTS